MKTLIKILFFAIVIAIGVGFYFKIDGETIIGDRIIGVSVLATTFILMPIFLAHRWKGKQLKDYMRTKS